MRIYVCIYVETSHRANAIICLVLMHLVIITVCIIIKCMDGVIYILL